MREVGTILALVVLATVVATGARRWRIPAPSLLVIAGVVVALIPGTPALHIPPQVIALVVLPPLLYASAEEMSLRDLRIVWKPVTVLALGLVLASAAAVGALAVALTPLTAPMAVVLGAVLASTDPVAVTALGRRLPLPGRVQTMVQAESLFNDATSLVMFKVAVGLAVAASAVSRPAAGGQFLVLAGGGALAGAAVAAAVALIRARTTDPVLETVIALVTPYAAYVLAEQAHTSGVTAVVVAGVVLGRSGHRLSDARIRLQVQAVYSVVVFLLESVVFAVIGLELPTLVRDLPAGSRAWPLQALALAAALIALRVLWVWPLSRVVRPVEGAASWRVAAVVTWAGTRGVMPLAAALSIPLVADDGTALPGRPLVLVLTTAVVVFTLVVQGLTLAPLVARSGLALEPQDTAREQEETRQHLAQAGLDHLDQLADLTAAPTAALTRLQQTLDTRLRHSQAQTTDADADHQRDQLPVLLAYHQLRREVIALQSTELQRLYEAHQISDTTRRQLQHDLDLEESGIPTR
ncbi:Na+/H+ antiporter [Streptacidiphilus carbonis]|uniref:Na+/H+ antiporter n=1 Tax=Streptacidiphilus carbonis TaxID=105422 RepID=UPI0005AA7BAF|nr:Na+/H+ antiporter [Streptacidiphilus carbonis]